MDEDKSQPSDDECEDNVLARYNTEQLKLQFAWNVKLNTPVSVKTIKGYKVLIRIN